MNQASFGSRGRVGRYVRRALAVLVVVGVAGGAATAGAQDIVLRWNDIAARTSAGMLPPGSAATNPFNQARIGSIVQLAVFEAVNAITPAYEPYLDPPTAAAPGASVAAAVVTAAHKVLTTYFPAPAVVAALDAERDADLGAIGDSPAKAAGVAVGLAAANAMIALRDGDGSSPGTVIVPTPTQAGDYQLTTGCTAAVLYNWQDVAPFGIARVRDFLLDPPAYLASNGYAKDYDEVHTVGAAASVERPADRADVVRLYAISSPSYLLSMATRQIAAARGTSVSENARALALIHMAISDALVASFFNKYHYNHWRPETGIHNGDADGNGKTSGDPAFGSFIATPCFPSYPSNHASGSRAGLEAVRRLFGAAGHDMTLSNSVPPLGSLPGKVVTIHYTQLKEIAGDVDDARVFGGIHWRYDQEAGNVLGRAVATAVVKDNLRPIHPQ